MAAKGKRFSNPLWRVLDSGFACINETQTEDDVRDALIPGRIEKKSLKELYEKFRIKKN